MDKPIRILHVLGRLDRGGAETMVMNLYRNIDRSKIQFDFVKHTTEKCDYDDEICKLGGQIFSISRYTGKNHFVYKKEWNDFFKIHTEYKIVHGHMRSTAAIYLKIAKQYNLITIAHSHSTASRGNKIEQFAKNIIQIPIRFTADYLFACSNEAGKWLFGKKAIKKDNYKIIKNAIDVEKYVFHQPKRTQVRKKIGLDNKYIIGHVGSFTYPKNHKFLINVFYEIQKQEEKAVLLLIGDGELKKIIEKQINKLGIKNKVILVGSVSNVDEYLQAMDVFIFPSKFEGLGISLIEAQVAGLQCFVSDKIPREAFISELVTSFGIEKDTTFWANEIMLSKQKSNFDRRKYGQKMQKSKYDIKKTSIDLVNLYLELV